MSDLDRGHEAPGSREQRADIQARIGGQDELPTPAESRAATWGDNPEYYDETAAEYDGDVDAFIAEQDELPTPQESRARTWGDDPEFYDGTDGQVAILHGHSEFRGRTSTCTPTAHAGFPATRSAPREQRQRRRTNGTASPTSRRCATSATTS